MLFKTGQLKGTFLKMGLYGKHQRLFFTLFLKLYSTLYWLGAAALVHNHYDIYYKLPFSILFHFVL